MVKVSHLLNQVVYHLKDNPFGCGTRYSAEKIRLSVLSDIAVSGRTVVLDFTGIPIISSGFADELVGKLVVELGFMNFTNNIKILGLTPNAQIVTERTVAQRMADALQKKK